MSDCEKCGKDLDEHPMIDVSNVKVLQMCDRHPKWQRVEPGHVIPAGQPYRVEYTKDNHDPDKVECKGRLSPLRLRDIHFEDADYFVDSSWRPPLVLPTEPTWGIAVHNTFEPGIGLWRLDGIEEFWDHEFSKTFKAKNVIDFIPLTEEQVQRIEAAR